tara:strand:+ start:289 stop:675 length:387 start_codon:yes stop_codon:yes gene_type:complete
MKIKNIETLVCSAGSRPWSFVRVCTSGGIVDYSECSKSFSSIRGVLGVIEDLKHLLIGRDPRAIERLFWDMYRMTRQSTGGVVLKAIVGFEKAPLILKLGPWDSCDSTVFCSGIEARICRIYTVQKIF